VRQARAGAASSARVHRWGVGLLVPVALLVASGAVVFGLATPAGASTQTFTSNGSFTVPSGVTSLNVEVIGFFFF